jgi:hypothetical protein
MSRMSGQRAATIGGLVKVIVAIAALLAGVYVAFYVGFYLVFGVASVLF